MRLTINLDDDLYAMARSHAIATRTSISKAVGDLLRRRAISPSSTPASSPSAGVHPVSGFPVSQGDGRSMTNEEIRRSLDDDLVRSLESMGRSAEEIAEALR
ncbi:hypothetical protein BH23VER1_BH23VER1_00870 [soil metagenome]